MEQAAEAEFWPGVTKLLEPPQTDLSSTNSLAKRMLSRIAIEPPSPAQKASDGVALGLSAGHADFIATRFETSTRSGNMSSIV